MKDGELKPTAYEMKICNILSSVLSHFDMGVIESSIPATFKWIVLLIQGLGL